MKPYYRFTSRKGHTYELGKDLWESWDTIILEHIKKIPKVEKMFHMTSQTIIPVNIKDLNFNIIEKISLFGRLKLFIKKILRRS